MPGRSGEALRLAIASASSHQQALVDEFLYERNVLMLAGAPGTGKSILAAQLALALTTGSVTFGSLQVPHPRSVYYLQLEGSEQDAFERLRRMGAKIPTDTEHLCWDFRKGLNLLDHKQALALLTDIAAWRKPDLLILDPLYQTVFGELSAELPTKALIRFLDMALTKFDPMAILLVHHTKKPSYSATGTLIDEDDPFYGSQWLKAYVDTSYLLKGAKTARKDHVVLVNKKDRHSSCAKELFLHYEPETDTVTTDVAADQQSGYERVLNYLRVVKGTGFSTDFYEVMEKCTLSYQHLRRIQLQLLAKGMIRCDKYSGKKKLWEVISV